MSTKRKRMLLNLGILLVAVTLLVCLLLPDYAGWVGLLLKNPEASRVAALVIRALLVLATGWIVLSATHHLFKRMVWKVAAFVALFVYGVVIYRDVIGTPYLMGKSVLC